VVPYFVVLPENRFAHAALTAESEESAAKRPVYLYGPSGCGKSHLAAHAVLLQKSRSPGLRVGQWTASEFAAEFAESSSNRTIPLFQTATRQIDLMVLEDVHALEGRPETQTQLLSLTNELLANDCQIFWTSHKSPGELVKFLPRLVSRFRGGVLAPIRLPGPASRQSLIEHFAKSRQIAMSPAAIRYLANDLAVSPRELQAAILRLSAVARQERRAVDSDLVRKFLVHDLPPPRVNLTDICRVVARQFGTTASDLRSRRRDRRSALPRQCAMLLARELTAGNLADIGRFFGGRDHSTVVHSCQRLKELLEQDPDLRSNLNQIRHALGVATAESAL
jgi:chromosomal replication initiator protein